MTVSIVNWNNSAYTASASFTMNMPANTLAGDFVLCFIVMKPLTANGGNASTTTPGWTLLGSHIAGGYGSTLTDDAGNTKVFVFYKHITDLSSLVIDLSDHSVAGHRLVSFRSDTMGYLTPVMVTANRDTAATSSTTLTSSSALALAAGDFLSAVFVIPTDVQTPNQFSAEAFTSTGITFAAAQGQVEFDTTTGMDLGGNIANSAVTAGSGNNVVNWTMSVAGTLTNVRGPVVFVRVRDDGAPKYTITKDLQTIWHTAESTGAYLIPAATVTQIAQASQTSMVITKPAAILTDMLIIAELHIASTAAITVPSGFVQIAMNESTLANPYRQYIWYKVATSSEPSNYTWSWTGGATREGHLYALKNVDLTNILYAAPVVNMKTTTSTTTTSVGVTTLATKIGIVRTGTDSVSVSNWLINPGGGIYPPTFIHQDLFKSVASWELTGPPMTVINRQFQGDASGYMGGIVFTVNSLTTVWLVSKDLQTIWNVEEPITAAPVGVDLDLRWNDLTVTSNTIDLRWNDLTVLGKSSDLRWSILAAVGKPVDLRWNVCLVVAKSLQTIWHVKLTVGKSADLRWNVRGIALKQLDLRWNDLTVTSKTISLPWNIRTTTGKTVDLRWNLRAAVGKFIGLLWSVESEQIPGQIGWYQAESIGYGDGDPVDFWPDDSPSNLDLTPIAGYSPTYVVNRLNGKPVVRFSRPNQMTLAASSPSAVIKHIFVVAMYRLPSFTNYDGLVSDYYGGGNLPLTGSAGATHWYYIAGTIYRLDGVEYPPNHPAPMDGKFGIISISTDAGWANMVLSIGQDRAIEDRLWDGDVAEVLAYDRVLTTPERLEVETYLTQKYFPPPPVGKSLDLKWNTQANVIVGKSLDLPWRVFSTLPKLLDVRWNVKTTTSKTLSLPWNIRTVVGKTVSLPWNIRSAVGKSLGLPWNTQTAVGKSTSLPWNVKTVTSKTLSLSWNLRSVTGKSVVLQWNVAEVIYQVGKDISYRWNVRTITGKSVTYIWNTRQVTYSTLSLQWNVTTPLSKTLSLQWNVTTPLGKTVQFVWTIWLQAYRELNLRWSVPWPTVIWVEVIDQPEVWTEIVDTGEVWSEIESLDRDWTTVYTSTGPWTEILPAEAEWQ